MRGYVETVPVTSRLCQSCMLYIFISAQFRGLTFLSVYVDNAVQIGLLLCFKL